MTKEQYQEILSRLSALGDDYFPHFESFRDEIHALGPKAMPYVLETALDEEFAFALDLLVIILSDTRYPPAMPHFVQWLDHENPEIRFSSACALDAAAGKKYDVIHMIEKGWVQHDKIAEVIPGLKAWWHEEGESSIPTELEWYGQQALKPKYTEQEKNYNFIEGNPAWAVLGNGIVRQPKDEPLPRHQGIHIISGTVLVQGETDPRFAAIEIDSDAGEILKVFVKERKYWIDVSDKSEWVKPKYNLVELPETTGEPDEPETTKDTNEPQGWFTQIKHWFRKNDK